MRTYDTTTILAALAGGVAVYAADHSPFLTTMFGLGLGALPLLRDPNVDGRPRRRRRGGHR